MTEPLVASTQPAATDSSMNLRPLLALGLAAPMIGATLLLSHGGGPSERGRLYVADLRTADVRSFDLAKHQERSRQSVAEDPHELAFAAGAAWTSNYRSTAVTRLIAGDTATEQLPVPGEPHGLATLADGRLAVTQGRAGEVALLDPHSGAVTAEVATGGEPHMAAAYGDRLFVVDAAGNALVELDPQSATVTRRVAVGTVPESLAVSPDGKTIAVANSRARSVSLIDR
jgi:DNA-binding beta-propeller fold protein YncE